MQIQAEARKVRVQVFLTGHPIHISQTKETGLSDGEGHSQLQVVCLKAFDDGEASRQITNVTLCTAVLMHAATAHPGRLNADVSVLP